MKILFYGGCHARVLRDIFRRWAVHPAVEADDLINFQLIAAGTPFPYAQLAGYDAVVFSPIENKAEYNTAHLVEHCRAAGIRTVSFPWMEWHGYFPRAAKGRFWNHWQWYYPDLLDHRRSFRRFDDFLDFVVAEYPDTATIDHVLQSTSAQVAATEDRTGTDIRVSELIARTYRQDRLFLIADHPSRHLYVHVGHQVAARLGVGLDPAFAQASAEPQEGWQTPVLPRVVRHLGLQFDGPHWQDIDRFPDGARLALRDYLRLYFAAEPGHAIATARTETRMQRPDGQAGGATAILVPAGRRLLLGPLRPLDHAVAEVDVLCTVGQAGAGEPAAAVPGAAYRLSPADWVLEGYSGT